MESKQEIENIYKQIVHRKAVFFTLPRNTTNFKLTNTLNEILSATLNFSNAGTAIYCAMMMPHPILAGTLTEDNASNNKDGLRPMDELRHRFTVS